MKMRFQNASNSLYRVLPVKPVPDKKTIDMYSLMIYNLNKDKKTIKVSIAMRKRNTIQRALVFEAVNQLKCHATADEIYEAIVKEHPNISRATVYRNLKQLAETGEIRKMETPGGADRFDHQCHDHYHVKCEKCGRFFDVDMAYISGLEKSIQNNHGFVFTGYDILFRGICPDCQKSSERHDR